MSGRNPLLGRFPRAIFLADRVQGFLLKLVRLHRRFAFRYTAVFARLSQQAEQLTGPHAEVDPRNPGRLQRAEDRRQQKRLVRIAAVFGVAVIAVWLLRRRRGADEDVLEPLTALGVLLAAQGLVGSVQYELKLPTDMVWVHVTLATVTWLVVLWAVAAAGRLAPRAIPVRAVEPGKAKRELEAAVK